MSAATLKKVLSSEVAADVAGIVADHSPLLAKLKAAGIMVAD